MIITIKNKDTLLIGDFKFKCSIGKKGFSKKKVEGDLTTPKGLFNLGNIYYRSDRVRKPFTKLKSISIKKNMGWCDDSNSKFYNKLINIKKNLKISYEKFYRKDHKYDFFILIKYNYKNPIKFKGSAIFLHLTKNYSPTKGCIALCEKDFLILAKLINKKTKIKIN
jgi:L,D-peptidoglycan transpeptidase YkuD (ErfK/YbiS/YcfS/YnhG family)